MRAGKQIGPARPAGAITRSNSRDEARPAGGNPGHDRTPQPTHPPGSLEGVPSSPPRSGSGGGALLQRSSAGGPDSEIGSTEDPGAVQAVLRSPGTPLDEETRGFMESRFHHDFSRVRLHTDARGAESARAVHAIAYTVGSDIAFRDGAFSPGTTAGRKLLAHELTHVVQQSPPPGGAAARPSLARFAISRPDDPLEREADRVAEQVLGSGGGTRATPSPLQISRAAPLIQREPDPDDTEIKKPDTPPPDHKPVPPPPGWKMHTPDVDTTKIANDIVGRKGPFKDTPIGTQIRKTVGGQKILFIVDWHKHPDTPEERERLKKLKLTDAQIEALVHWHRGCSVYEPAPEPKAQQQAAEAEPPEPQEQPEPEAPSPLPEGSPPAPEEPTPNP